MEQKLEPVNRKIYERSKYHRTQMQKELVVQKLKDRDCRITKQRLMLLTIILEEDCSCCKEIYYKAVKKDERIGIATVYRMINILEEIGALSRKNMYKISCCEECDVQNVCTVELDDDTVFQLTAKKWNLVITAGLKACGYTEQQNMRSIVVNQCQCEE